TRVDGRLRIHGDGREPVDDRGEPDAHQARQDRARRGDQRVAQPVAGAALRRDRRSRLGRVDAGDDPLFFQPGVRAAHLRPADEGVVGERSETLRRHTDMSSIIAEGGAATADYTADFYSKFNERSYRAAGILLGEIHAIHPFGSMVDFGCGSGTWLRAAAGIVRAQGRAPELLGVDGAHVGGIAYREEGGEYLLQDLEEPVRLRRRYDLAISLEVAEHLSPSRGPGFVEDLCAASDVVIFGASIPGQGGLEGGVHHVNERWQDYWVG